MIKAALVCARVCFSFISPRGSIQKASDILIGISETANEISLFNSLYTHFQPQTKYIYSSKASDFRRKLDEQKSPMTSEEGEFFAKTSKLK